MKPVTDLGRSSRRSTGYRDQADGQGLVPPAIDAAHQHEREKCMRPLRKRSDRDHQSESRKRVSYANVASTLALVLAIGGGTAWAAHHYSITSTKQIKPSVLKKLHGARGAKGTNGTNGTNGATGSTGATGATGPSGPNGAIAGYSALTSVTTAFTGMSNAVIVSKTLPAGNYVLNGSVTFTAASTATTTQFDVACTLRDSGTGTATDTSSYTGLTNFIVVIVPTNINSLSMNVAVSTTVPTTASITCSDIENTGNTFQISSDNAALTAVQTTTNS